MTVKGILSFILLFVIGFSEGGRAATSGLQDVSYRFDPVKLQAAKDPFYFFRSFVDLFYLVYKANPSSFPLVKKLSTVQGWCAGDAHLENFGALLQQNRQPLFTINDMDDSGPCPIVLDLFRFLVSAQLADSDIKIEKALVAYVKGLQRKNIEVPSAIRGIFSKSESFGFNPSESKVKNGKFIRESGANEVTAAERQSLQAILKGYQGVLVPNPILLDVIKETKVGGGSGGLLRYQVLLNNGGQVLHFEFKELVTPAIYSVATAVPTAADRIKASLAVDQGVGASQFYRVVQLAGKDLLIRPRFAGNIGVSLNKLADSEEKEVVYFEAYTLGLVHLRAISDHSSWIKMLNAISVGDFIQEVKLMAGYFKKKYQEVK